MKIGIVCYPTFGGSGIVATELGMALANRGHEIHFIAYSQPVKLGFFLEHINFHQVVVPDYPLFHYEPYELALSSKIVDVVKTFNLDLLHVHYAIPHAYAAYNAKQILAEENINISIVTTLHGTDITLVGRNQFYKPAVTFSINKSDIVTSVSNSLKKDTIDIFGIKRNIEVIHNFINHKNYTLAPNEACPRHMFAKKEEKIIVHVSNFRKLKRINDVIQVYYEIQKKIPAKLIMVGEGEETEKAELLTRKLGIDSKVRFIGESRNVNKILAISDLFLLLSEHESFGLSVLEAMAAKTPVISTNTGGLTEVNRNDFSGYTLNVGDIKSMVEKSIYILKNEKRLLQFKQNAYNQSKKFDVEEIVSAYEQVYKKAINKTQ